MHEIRATVPTELTEEAARLAHEAGIERVSIAEVFIHGPGLARRIVSADTSTPKARAFVDALLNSPAFSGADYALTSREVRSIVSAESADDTGRRYLIGVAAAVQLAIFPVWLGAALVLGLPAHAILYSRLLSFGINLVTIAAAGVGAYAILHLGAGRGWGSPRSGPSTR